MTDAVLIRRLWGTEALAPLWDACRRRLEQGSAGTSPFVFNDADAATRTAVATLLGERVASGPLRVSPAKLEARLRASAAACGIVDVVEALGGSVRDRRTERAVDAARWGRIWADAAGHPALERHPKLAEFLDRLRRTGRLRRSDDPEGALGRCLTVCAALPAGPQSRATLAAALFGSAHALDDDDLVTAALACAAGEPAPSSRSGRRDVWAMFDVEVEPVRSRVTVLGVVPDPAGPVTTAAAAWAASGVPLVVHLGAVTAERWTVAPGTVVSVCENPTVIDAAARRLGPAAAPLVCVEGQLSVAARVLLRSLTDAGARLRYHGDFGAGGIHIANGVIRGLGAAPWRMGVGDHRAALAAVGPDVALPPLRGTVPEACWDPDLASAVRACGVEVEEEHAPVLEQLLADLRS